MKNFKFLFLFLLVSGITIGGCRKEPDRDKFLGSYQVNENCSSGNYNYSMTIIESAISEEGIVIQNMGDFGVNLNATVNGDNISLNDTKDGVTITGSGSISGNTLTIVYTASLSGVTDNCTATGIKQ
jgi:hypothetical protein